MQSESETTHLLSSWNSIILRKILSVVFPRRLCFKGKDFSGNPIAHLEEFSLNLAGAHFIFLFLLLFKYSCLHFPTTTLPCPTHPYLPSSILPLSLAFFMGPLYTFLDNPSPSFPCSLPPLSCLIPISLFFLSMFLVGSHFLIHEINQYIAMCCSMMGIHPLKCVIR